MTKYIFWGNLWFQVSERVTFKKLESCYKIKNEGIFFVASVVSAHIERESSTGVF